MVDLDDSMSYVRLCALIFCWFVDLCSFAIDFTSYFLLFFLLMVGSSWEKSLPWYPSFSLAHLRPWLFWRLIHAFSFLFLDLIVVRCSFHTFTIFFFFFYLFQASTWRTWLSFEALVLVDLDDSIYIVLTTLWPYLLLVCGFMLLRNRLNFLLFVSSSWEMSHGGTY